ncbi:MAG: hypothetical protein ACREYE_13425 [Gammaproteobacteria bacterium]
MVGVDVEESGGSACRRACGEGIVALLSLTLAQLQVTCNAPVLAKV